jgi:hypothetical protein
MSKAFWLVLLTAAHLDAAKITLAGAEGLQASAEYGVGKLVQALESRGHTVLRGEAEADYFVLARCQTGMAPSGEQSLAIRRMRHRGKPAFSICGGGPRGLMYAALELAERIGWTANSTDPFARVREAKESPYLTERGISIYTMQRAYFESRLFDETYWMRYFDLLAPSRINTFTIIFGSPAQRSAADAASQRQQ